MRNDIQELVLEAVRAERAQQDLKHGGPGHDACHSWGDWMSFIKECVPDDPLAANEVVSDEKAKAALIEIAALAIAALECRARRAVLADLRQ